MTITDREGKPVHLYVVTVERTYSCDFVVAATNQTDARKVAERDCDPSDDGDMDTTAFVVREVFEASHLPAGLELDDETDARAHGVAWHTIGDFLGPQESPEERAVRIHNEHMATLQGSLF